MTNRAPNLSVLADMRSLLVAFVLGAAVIDANWVVHRGITICVVVLLCSIRLVKVTPAELAAGGLALLTACSLAWTTNDRITTLAVVNAFSWAVLFFTVRVTVRRPRDLRIVIYGLLAGCLLALGRIWLTTGFEIRITYSSLDARLGIEGINYNYLAYSFATCAAALTILWHIRVERGRGLPRPLLAGFGFLMYVGVLLNGTRGAIVGLAALAVWWLLARFAPRRALGMLVAASAILAATLFLGWVDQRLQLLVAGDGVRETGDLNGRLTMWPIARDAFWDSPLIGHGAGGMQALPLNRFGIGAHNALLDVGVGLGAVGVVLFLAALVAALHWEPKAWSSSHRAQLVGSFLAVSTPILLSGYWTESMIFWGTLGLFSRLGVLRATGDLEDEPIAEPTRSAAALPA